ncbi:MAG: M24 family metallopeptidase [Candidatus Methanodesulfokora sp.]
MLRGSAHGISTDRRISEGDILIIDFGAKYKGYCSDITRTFSIGKPPERAVEVYEIMRGNRHKAKIIVMLSFRKVNMYIQNQKKN